MRQAGLEEPHREPNAGPRDRRARQAVPFPSADARQALQAAINISPRVGLQRLTQPREIKPFAAAQGEEAALMLDDSPVASRQADIASTLADRIEVSPRMVAQRQLIRSAFRPTASSGPVALHKAAPGTSANVVQREKASIAIFGQSHNDENFLDKLCQEIQALIKSRIPFVVCMEEAPGISWGKMISEYEEALESGKLPQEVAAQLKGDLPIFRLLEAHGIPVYGVDAMIEPKRSSGESGAREFERQVDEAEFKRLQAMTKGILGAAGRLSKQGGGVVVGLNFGNNHIAGLLKKLKESGYQGSTAGTISVGGYLPRKKLDAAKRNVESQRDTLKKGEQQKIRDAQSLAEYLDQLIDDFYVSDTLEELGLTVTCTEEYQGDIHAVMQNAIEKANSSGRREGTGRALSSSSIRLDVVDDGDFRQLARESGSEQDPLLRSHEPQSNADDSQCCCIVQ